MTLATVLLAGGAGLAVDHFATPRAQPAPALKTVSAPMLAKLGITLSAPTEPLYCSVAGAVVSHGWLHSGVASCAISQSAAEAAASLGGGVRVVESVLAQVTSSRVLAVGRDLLAWVVVTQQSFSTPSNCGTINGGRTCTSVTWSGFIWSVIVIVDARSGGVVDQQQLNAVGRGRITPGYRLPGTVPTGA